jgi:hypothetical protein
MAKIMGGILDRMTVSTYIYCKHAMDLANLMKRKTDGIRTAYHD